LFAFLVLGHGRRQLLWFSVTRNPTAEWLAQQITEAFPWKMAPNLVCDNDSAYGLDFRRRLRAMGIRDRPTSLRSPWQNPYAERLIGTLRRVCLDHVLIFGERHLLRILSYIRLLQPDVRALGIEQGCAATASRAKIRNHCCHSNSVRIASSLRADMILGRTGLLRLHSQIAQPPRGDLCHEAPAPAVAASRSSATGSIDNSPGRFFLH
jgi:hypothetical protein